MSVQNKNDSAEPLPDRPPENPTDSEARESQGQPEKGKDFYTVVPGPGADTPETVDFVKKTVGADDLLPWTDFDDKLISWTVEASEDEVSRLRDHDGIDRVTKLESPSSPEKVTRDTSDASTPKPPANGKDYYTIFPETDTDTSKTAAFVKDTVGADDLLPWTDVNENLISWTVEASKEEVSRLEEHAGIDRVTKLDLPPQPRNIPRGDPPSDERDSYVIFPTDGKNKKQCSETEKSLEKFLKEKIAKPYIDDGKVVWWVTQNMTAAEAKKAKAVSGVHAVETNPTADEFFTIPEIEHRSPSAELSAAFDKRDLSYHKQDDAARELVAISQPKQVNFLDDMTRTTHLVRGFFFKPTLTGMRPSRTIPDLNNLKNYVYESHNGEGTFVYHLERGVAYEEQKDEFKHVATEHILTEAAKAEGKLPQNDESVKYSHTTCTAGKAVGQEFGVSKKSTLIVVKIALPKYSEIVEAVGLIAADVAKRPERRKKSVVTFSLGVTRNDNPNIREKMKENIKKLVDVDVPFIVAAGNSAKEPGRTNVDTQPATLESPDLPIIVVGSVDDKGKKSSFSQRGPHVSLHAVGVDIKCVTKKKGEIKTLTGTSYSAPEVAGEVANLLSYDKVPFDTSDGHLVKNVKEYLMSDKGSWERVAGTRVLWNGVKEEHNPKVGGQSHGGKPKAKVSCNGLKAKKYVERDHLKDLVEDKFCPDAVKQGGLDKGSEWITRLYNKGTPEEVGISMHFKAGDFKPNQKDCAKYLRMAVDGCDGDDPKGNPENYKGGGLTTYGDTSYRISPKSVRRPAEDGKKGNCKGSYKFLFDQFTIWGAGFDGNDNGASLKKQLKGCALFSDHWQFKYELGDDGREWTAKFRTGVFQKHCVGDALKTVSGIKDIGCGGSG